MLDGQCDVGLQVRLREGTVMLVAINDAPRPGRLYGTVAARDRTLTSRHGLCHRRSSLILKRASASRPSDE